MPQEIDYAALAKKFGGTSEPAPQQAQPSGIDYAGLAAKFGGRSEMPDTQMPSTRAPVPIPPLLRPEPEGIGARIFNAIMDTTGGDPNIVGFADPAGLVGGASFQSLPQVLKGLAGGTRFAEFLKKRAAKQYAQVLNPTKETTKHVTQKSVPRLLNEKVMATSREALQRKAREATEAASMKLEEAWEKLPNDKTMDTRPILDALENAKKAYIEKITTQQTKTITSPIVDEFGGPISREVTENVTRQIESVPEAVRNLTQLQDIIKQYGDNVSPQSLRRIRQAWDSLVSRAGGYQGKSLSEVTKVDARMEGANAIRAELGKAFPDIAKINSEFHFWRGIDDVLGQTIQRVQGQAKPLGERLITAAGVGGTVGGIASGYTAESAVAAATIVGLTKLVRSPGWKTVSAVTKNELAKSIAGGNFAQSMAIIARLGAAMGAQLNQ